MKGASAGKTLEAMRANPLDWRIDDLKKSRGPSASTYVTGGSHVYFTHARVREGLSVPARRPIKPVYIRAFVRFVDQVSEL